LPLKGEALYCGFYVNELVMRLLGRNDPHEGLFPIYHKTLSSLAQGDHVERSLRRFELGLLQILGYGMVLDREAQDGQPVRPEARYRYRIESGPEPSGLAEPEPGTLSGATLLALAQDRPLDPTGLREARRLMRRVLNHYLDGRPLRSRELFATAVRRPREHG
jgi:DNA repair protein RecO (recombination protein O)